MSYRPRPLTYVVPAYCAAKQWIVVVDEAGVAALHYVESVDRRWKDGEASNGVAPCLLYVLGQPKPWFFDSGHEYVSVLAQDHRSED